MDVHTLGFNWSDVAARTQTLTLIHLDPPERAQEN
jgi:hypothetical protein